MKYILIMFILFSIIRCASAGTDITGSGGNEWNGNVTFDNSMAYNSTGYVYPRPYPDSGLVHYWPVENGTGTTLYDEIGGDDITINGGTWNASGVSGYCIDLDGSNGGLDTNVDYEFVDFSISMHTRFNSFTSPDTYAATFGNYVEYHGLAISNTRYQYNNRNSSDELNIDNASLDLSGWNHFQHLRDNSTGLFSLYVDNSFSGSDTIIGPLYDLNKDLYFATKYEGLTNRLNGSMDDIRAYNVDLDSSSRTSVYNIEYYSSSNITRNYSSLLGSGEELQTFSFNGSANDSTKKYTIRTSIDGVTYNVFQYDASPYPTSYDISGNGYECIMVELNTSDATQILILHNMTGVYGSGDSAPTISSYAPATPNSTYENVASTYNATIDQSNSNNEWLINGTRYEWDNGTDSPSYTNSTLINGTYNLTLTSHNSSTHSLTDSQTWIVTVQLNSVDMNITYYNPDNLTANLIFNLSNKTAGLQTINISYSGTNISNEYCLVYLNGTAVQACITATSEGETIWFNGSANRLPVADGYYINETILVDTKFEYYNGTGWQEGESYYYLWFTCFWWTAECANDEQSSGQATLRITNNGTASGTPKMKLNESAPSGIRIFVDDDNTFAGAVELTNTYQAVSTSLNQDANVTLWAWANLSGASAWEFETYAIVE